MTDETAIWPPEAGPPGAVALEQAAQQWSAIETAAKLGAPLACEAQARWRFVGLLAQRMDKKAAAKHAGLKVVARAVDLAALRKTRPDHYLTGERLLRRRIVESAAKQLGILAALRRPIRTLRSIELPNSEDALDLWADLVALTWYEFGDESDWLLSLDEERLVALLKSVLVSPRHPAREMIKAALTRRVGLERGLTKAALESLERAAAAVPEVRALLDSIALIDEDKEESRGGGEWRSVKSFPAEFERQRPFRDGPKGLIGRWLREASDRSPVEALRGILALGQTPEHRVWVVIGASTVLSSEAISEPAIVEALGQLDPSERLVAYAAVLRRLENDRFETEARVIGDDLEAVLEMKRQIERSTYDVKGAAPWLPRDLIVVADRFVQRLESLAGDLRRKVDERVAPPFLRSEPPSSAREPDGDLVVVAASLQFDSTRSSEALEKRRREFQGAVLWCLDNDLGALTPLLRDVTLPPEFWSALWEVGVWRNSAVLLKTFDGFVVQPWALETAIGLVLRAVPTLSSPLALSESTTNLLVRRLGETLAAVRERVRGLQNAQVLRDRTDEGIDELLNGIAVVLAPVQMWAETLRQVRHDATEAGR